MFLQRAKKVKLLTISPPYDIYSLTKAKELWAHILSQTDLDVEVVLGILCDYAIDWSFR
jgi:hypothetical protein